MAQSEKLEIGSITWADLTVKNAPAVKDFYAKVVGWEVLPVPMGEYEDFSMNIPNTDKPAAGICNLRGVNADLPSQWLIYITVEDIDKSIKSCKDLNGKVIVGPRNMGNYGRFCVIEDPSGAVAALFMPVK